MFLHHLDNLATLRRLIEFYVVEHNRTIPHNAFRGQTPDEMHFGRGATVPDELAERRREARKRRVEQNRHTACTNRPQDESSPDEDIAA